MQLSPLFKQVPLFREMALTHKNLWWSNIIYLTMFNTLKLRCAKIMEVILHIFYYKYGFITEVRLRWRRQVSSEK